MLQLDQQTGLHPALEPLMALWKSRELAVVQGVGYPDANLSHFRSIEIWDTASKSNEYLTEGWLARAFAAAPAPATFAADGVVVGGAEMGPFAGRRARDRARPTPEQFLRQARLAAPAGQARNAALHHILRVEQDIVQAAARLNGNHAFATEFPAHAVRQRDAHRGAGGRRQGRDRGHQGRAERLRHPQQPAGAPRAAAQGRSPTAWPPCKGALVEIGRWDSTLIMTYSEFGRRPRENLSSGTDHGTASAHFVLGGRVKGGLYGLPPALSRLDGNGNLPFAVDFRDLYATVLERWWGADSTRRAQGPLRASRRRPGLSLSGAAAAAGMPAVAVAGIRDDTSIVPPPPSHFRAPRRTMFRQSGRGRTAFPPGRSFSRRRLQTARMPLCRPLDRGRPQFAGQGPITGQQEPCLPRASDRRTGSSISRAIPAKDILAKVRFISRFYGEGEQIAPQVISQSDEIAQFIARIEHNDAAFQRQLSRAKVRALKNFYEMAVSQPPIPGTVLLFTSEKLRFPGARPRAERRPPAGARARSS